jgi:hypothetical protein
VLSSVQVVQVYFTTFFHNRQARQTSGIHQSNRYLTTKDPNKIRQDLADIQAASEPLFPILKNVHQFVGVSVIVDWLKRGMGSFNDIHCPPHLWALHP